jgi:hypothetical protein
VYNVWNPGGQTLKGAAVKVVQHTQQPFVMYFETQEPVEKLILTG